MTKKGSGEALERLAMQRAAGEQAETRREAFLREAMVRPEGISAEREKFVRGLKTGSGKKTPQRDE